MKRTLNYSGRHDLDKQDINITRKPEDGGIQFGIMDDSDTLSPYDDADMVILYAQDALLVERINIGTVADLKALYQDKIYPIKDRTILHSQNLSLDVHIVSPDGKIQSRTDKISLGKGTKPSHQGTDTPFNIQTKDIGDNIYEIQSEGDRLIFCVSDKIPKLAQKLQAPDSMEFALFAPIILKEAFTHALITEPDSTGDTVEYWKKAVIQYNDTETYPEETTGILQVIHKFSESFTQKKKLQKILIAHYRDNTDD